VAEGSAEDAGIRARGVEHRGIPLPSENDLLAMMERAGFSDVPTTWARGWDAEADARHRRRIVASDPI